MSALFRKLALAMETPPAVIVTSLRVTGLELPSASAKITARPPAVLNVPNDWPVKLTVVLSHEPLVSPLQ